MRFIKGHARRIYHGPCRHCDRPVCAKGLCRGHYDKFRRTGVEGGPLALIDTDRLSRYLAKVDKGDPDECWPWTAARSDKNYGQYADGDGHSMPAHRFGFEALVRPLEPGEVVDHVCHNRAVEMGTCQGGDTCEHRACQNPAHWEAKDGESNVRLGQSFSAVNGRKEVCKWGHDLTPDNLYWHGPKKNRRACKKCALLAARGIHPRQLAKKQAA